MIECLILGDSIATGIYMAMPWCTAKAEVGINSRNFNRKYGSIEAVSTVIISLGTNDAGLDTEAELRKLRTRIKADQVYWVIPAHNQDAAYKVAAEFGDRLIQTNQLSPDKIHPTMNGYRELAKQIQG